MGKVSEVNSDASSFQIRESERKALVIEGKFRRPDIDVTMQIVGKMTIRAVDFTEHSRVTIAMDGCSLDLVADSIAQLRTFAGALIAALDDVPAK